MGYDIEVVTTTVRPTAVVCRTTSWDEFPALWKQLLDEVYAFLRTSDVHQAGHNVMVYLTQPPTQSMSRRRGLARRVEMNVMAVSGRSNYHHVHLDRRVRGCEARRS